MKRIALLLLALIMAFCFFGCAKPEAEIIENEYVVAVNAAVGGETKIKIGEEKNFKAEAKLNEGEVVEGWKLNGALQENAKEETFEFKADKTTMVEAVVRPEKKVNSVNAEMYFLDDKGKAGGEAFTEFVFEKDYTNPLTKETVPGGKIDIMLKAVVPSGYVIDYWLINGVTYDHNLGSIIIKNLDETTTYEAVLKKEEVKYYTVTCRSCSYNGKQSARVKAGTKITVKGYASSVGSYEVNGAYYCDTTDYKMTITVNKDLNIVYYAVIN